MAKVEELFIIEKDTKVNENNISSKQKDDGKPENSNVNKEETKNNLEELSPIQKPKEIISPKENENTVPKQEFSPGKTAEFSGNVAQGIKKANQLSSYNKSGFNNESGKNSERAKNSLLEEYERNLIKIESEDLNEEIKGDNNKEELGNIENSNQFGTEKFIESCKVIDYKEEGKRFNPDFSNEIELDHSGNQVIKNSFKESKLEGFKIASSQDIGNFSFNKNDIANKEEKHEFNSKGNIINERNVGHFNELKESKDLKGIKNFNENKIKKNININQNNPNYNVNKQVLSNRKKINATNENERKQIEVIKDQDGSSCCVIL